MTISSTWTTPGGEHPNWDLVLKNRPSLLNYWRRQSPDYLVATRNPQQPDDARMVDLDDPPPTLSGMVALTLDPLGRLVQLLRDSAAERLIPLRPRSLMTGSRCSLSRDWTCRSSMRRSRNGLRWERRTSAPRGPACGPGLHEPLRVEAAAWHGKPVFFRLISEWTKADRMPSARQREFEDARSPAGDLSNDHAGGAVWLARRNYRTQKSDPAGRDSPGPAHLLLADAGVDFQRTLRAEPGTLRAVCAGLPAARFSWPRFSTSCIWRSSRTSGVIGRTPSSPGRG